jgi:hypothetical protein
MGRGAWLGAGRPSPRAGKSHGQRSLVVTDIEAARAELADRGVDVSDVFHDSTGVFNHSGAAHRVPGADPQRGSYASWASFEDPDGNGWVLQEITTRLPGR